MLGSAVGLGSAGLGSAVGSIIKSGVLLTNKNNLWHEVQTERRFTNVMDMIALFMRVI